MLKPKSDRPQHWETISDEDLLNAELVIDNPLAVAGLVLSYPEGDAEPHVESSYDLRGSGAEEFKCVHGSHGHLKGFVFRKGDARYLVGWQCGASIYGEKFNVYTANHKAAVTRKTGLQRLEDIRSATIKFSQWIGDPSWAVAIEAYENLRRSLSDDMPFVWDLLGRHGGGKLRDVSMPRYLTMPYRDAVTGEFRNDVEGEYVRLTKEMMSIMGELSKPNIAALALIGAIVERLHGVIRRAERIYTKLSEVELFFQPATLDAICKEAEVARPRRATHTAGLLKITSRKIVIEMTEASIIPSRAGIDALLTALNKG